MSTISEEEQKQFEQVSAYEWNEEKRRTNLLKHKIDFADAVLAFDGPILVKRSDRYGEIRYQVFGAVQDQEIAITCTLRGPICRIISVRRARRDERRKHYHRPA